MEWGLSMKKEIEQILETVTDEKKLNTDRYQELLKRSDESEKLNANRYHELKTGLDDSKDSWHQLMKGFTEAQALADQRYHELKRSIEDVSSKIATKDQLNQVYESLSQDITFMFGNHHRLKKRVSQLEKRVGKLEGDLP